MDDSSIEQSGKRMPIPYGRTALPVSLMTAFILGSVVLAIFNLTNIFTLTLFQGFAAITWLLLVVGAVWLFIHEEGVGKLWLELLGLYARTHFVEAKAGEGGEVVLCFGYECFGRKRYYLRAEASTIVSVHWSTGQATDRVGRDMRDWTVWLWYLDPARADQETDLDIRAKHENYQVGPTGPREKTERLGHGFIDFLREAGLDMVATGKDAEFNVRGKSLPDYPKADLMDEDDG